MIQVKSAILIFSRIVDSTVIVTEHKQTKKDDLQKIVTNIQNVGGKIAGIVLNKIPVSAKKYEQSYYYGSTAMTPSKTRGARFSQTNKSKNVQNKMEDMKKRVKPENPQIARVQQEEMQKENQDEQPKSLENNIKIESSDNISLEKTTDILNQINAYLDEEKKKLSNKS